MSLEEIRKFRRRYPMLLRHANSAWVVWFLLVMGILGLRKLEWISESTLLISFATLTGACLPIAFFSTAHKLTCPGCRYPLDGLIRSQYCPQCRLPLNGIQTVESDPASEPATHILAVPLAAAIDPKQGDRLSGTVQTVFRMLYGCVISGALAFLCLFLGQGPTASVLGGLAVILGILWIVALQTWVRCPGCNGKTVLDVRYEIHPYCVKCGYSLRPAKAKSE